MEPKDRQTTLTVQELRRRLFYHPEVGVFTHLIEPNNNMKGCIRTVAGSLRDGKYWVITIDGFTYYAHRLVWLYVYGSWPTSFIDHINGIKSDNRLANLREASYAENQANIGPKVTSRTRLKGVTICGNRWKAQITKDRKVHYLGLYTTREEAYTAYCKAAQELQEGFASTPAVEESPKRLERGDLGRTDLGVRRDNMVGLRGVSPLGSKFRAQIYVGGKARHLGVFATKEEAYAAYCKAAEENSRPNENEAS